MNHGAYMTEVTPKINILFVIYDKINTSFVIVNFRNSFLSSVHLRKHVDQKFIVSL